MAKQTRVFSLSIYKKEALLEAKEAYKNFATFSLVQREDEIQVEIEVEQEEQIALIVDSFCNHVLFQSIVGYRQENGGEL